MSALERSLIFMRYVSPTLFKIMQGIRRYNNSILVKRVKKKGKDFKQGSRTRLIQ